MIFLKEFFYYLEDLGIHNQETAIKRVLDATEDELLEIVQYIHDTIPTNLLYKETRTLFNFIANSTLGGAPHPCSSLDCRLDNINKLSRFAALYADNVLIPSPFDKYHNKESIEKDILIGDLLVLFEIRPLLEAGIINFTSNEIPLCVECLSSAIKEFRNLEEELKVWDSIISDEFLNNIKFFLDNENDPSLLLVGPDEYGFHGEMYIKFRYYVPEAFKPYIRRGEIVELPRDAVIKERIVDFLVAPILDDLVLQNIIGSETDITFLTHRDIDIQVLNAFHSKEEFEISNNMYKGLSHLLPLVENVSLENIIKLREAEGEAFQVYRDALTEVVSDLEFKDEKSFKKAYKEIIKPELNKIELILKNNKKGLLGSIATDLIYGATFATIGISSGLLPSTLEKILGALGGAKLIHNIYQHISPLQSVRNERFYFLWKMQKYDKKAI